jgi:hypothetical protein
VTEDDIQEAGLQGAGMGGVVGRENAVNNRMEPFDIKDDFYVESEKKVYECWS